MLRLRLEEEVNMEVSEWRRGSSESLCLR